MVEGLYVQRQDLVWPIPADMAFELPADHVADTPAQPDCAGPLTDALKGLRVRHVAFSDALRDARESLLGSLFTQVEHAKYVENDFRFVSRVQGDFDVLCIGGQDPRRMTRLMRTIAPMLGNRARIALLSQSDAPGRAQLLGSGFDDVIDPAKVTPAEAAARIAAIWARYRAAHDMAMQLKQADESLAHAAHVDLLTRTEKRILAELLRCEGRDVPFAQLCRVMGLGTCQASMNNLRVVISKLRPKLRAQIHIYSVRGRGYRLIART